MEVAQTTESLAEPAMNMAFRVKKINCWKWNVSIATIVGETEDVINHGDMGRGKVMQMRRKWNRFKKQMAKEARKTANETK